ncbi:ABC transporter substrate-binding protein [Bradyrhizobium sp. Ash2021]|uniref:ABC transporter substrate-binding protein n=1 Tax=Bradyrhizobium sp. Ash2021 TaxID=2954771 RepID=UPI002815922A|nr:ABC transporter substrate-binding protein [Bradyrhizobium sp. Ash2021]WMT73473.1 ABC transporter substrate-binding protein [Bradyrhizobium sp. Ash2021]
MLWQRIISVAVLAASIVIPGAVKADPAGKPVKIGVLNDQSGPYADITGQGSVVAAQMAIDDFGGKVLGQPIQLVFADHQNKPDVGVAIAGRWLDNEGVDAIVDLPNSGVMLAVQELVKNKSGIVLAAGGAAAKFNQSSCTPYSFQWVYDTYALANGTATALTKSGGKTWYFVQVDNAFGTAMAADMKSFIESAGGSVVGSVKHPLNTSDFSSFILQGQASKSDVLLMINAGADTINSLKQGADFNVVGGGQKLATSLFYLMDAKSLGLAAGQGLTITDGYYWALNDATRAFGDRFAKLHQGRKPTSVQIGVYSAVTHYLKAVAAAGSHDRAAIADKMRELPVNDVFVKDGKARKDGVMQHDIYLLQLKKPSEATGDPWDMFNVLRTIPAETAFRPIEKSECPLLKQ